MVVSLQMGKKVRRFRRHRERREWAVRMGRSYAKYIAALLLFGSNGIVASYISLSSYEIVFMRTLVGSCVLVAFFIVMHGKPTFPRHRRSALYLLVSGMALGIGWIFLYEAYRQVGVGAASLVYYCGPVIVMALSPLLFNEGLTRPKMIGFVAVLCGVFLIEGQALQGSGNMWGLLCGAVSAVMYAVMVIFTKKAEGIDGPESSVLQLVAAFVAVAVFVGIREGFAFQIDAVDWPPILMLGLVNTGIGCYLYFSAMGRLPVQSVSILGYLEPLSAVVLSVIFLQEAFGPAQMLGAFLILGGAVLGECAKIRSHAHPKRTEKECTAPVRPLKTVSDEDGRSVVFR